MAKHAAFDILYQEYYVRVFGLCRRLLNSPQQAEDAAQEVFMRAYKSFAKYNAKQPFWQWIAAIANNYCIDVLRQRTRSNALFGSEAAELEQIASTDTPPLTNLMTAEANHALNNALASLPDKYRVPLVLAYYNQSSYEEIASQLNISRNHVGVLLLRAKQQLRSAFQHMGQEDQA